MNICDALAIAILLIVIAIVALKRLFVGNGLG